MRGLGASPLGSSVRCPGAGNPSTRLPAEIRKRRTRRQAAPFPANQTSQPSYVPQPLHLRAIRWVILTAQNVPHPINIADTAKIQGFPANRRSPPTNGAPHVYPGVRPDAPTRTGGTGPGLGAARTGGTGPGLGAVFRFRSEDTMSKREIIKTLLAGSIPERVGLNELFWAHCRY